MAQQCISSLQPARQQVTADAVLAEIPWQLAGFSSFLLLFLLMQAGFSFWVYFSNMLQLVIDAGQNVVQLFELYGGLYWFIIITRLLYWELFCNTRIDLNALDCFIDLCILEGFFLSQSACILEGWVGLFSVL